MRLIDADALKEKLKEHYDLFVGDYKGEHMSLADELRVDEILNSMAEVINAPIVFDTENVTNGDVIKIIFSNAKYTENFADVEMKTEENDTRFKSVFDRDWWDATYQIGENE